MIGQTYRDYNVIDRHITGCQNIHLNNLKLIKKVIEGVQNKIKIKNENVLLYMEAQDDKSYTPIPKLKTKF